MKTNRKNGNRIGKSLSEFVYIRIQLQRFLVIAVSDTSVHKLRYFEHFQQLRVFGQHLWDIPPPDTDLLGLCFKSSTIGDQLWQRIDHMMDSVFHPNQSIGHSFSAFTVRYECLVIIERQVLGLFDDIWPQIGQLLSLVVEVIDPKRW